MRSDLPSRPRSSTLATTVQSVTPMAFVKAIVEAYARRGMDPGKALNVAQITPKELADPASRISAAQMECISGAAMQELDDEALGWFSRRLPWGSYGMLARASISAASLGVALKRWCRHHALIADDITLSLKVTGDWATLYISEQRDLGVLREFCLVSVLRNIHGLACWLIDSRLPLLGAQFPFAPPPHHEVYAVLFPGPTAFDSAPAALRFDARYLALPLRRDESALQQMLQRALPLTVHQYRHDRLLLTRVRQALASQPARSHNADDLAALLHVSARTLHRQLKEKGSSLQTLKDEVRQRRSRDLLLRSARPIKQVAEAVGFRNEKSFIRAFQAWVGQSPSEFRRAGQP
ncbi:MAG: AraC family transcriptional regulator [Rhodoferax sp.]|uniref:AraC family transcriptional regulator n=1 Tax=Rhodoferax sp. TaxID=50421 RepID=UPI00260B449E|nr:AraC family transcriptional regulator [Rhodoferax sp.]MDD5333858.1 AraC family transcriptional regulator [Rhodoferax sp.]